MDALLMARQRVAELERENKDLRLRWEIAEKNMELWRTRYHATIASPSIPDDTVFCGGVGGGLLDSN